MNHKVNVSAICEEKLQFSVSYHNTIYWHFHCLYLDCKKNLQVKIFIFVQCEKALVLAKCVDG